MPLPGTIFLLMAIGFGVFLSKTPDGRFSVRDWSQRTRREVLRHRRRHGFASGFIRHPGLLAGVASLIYVARFDTAKADVGKGFELDVITAVVLGGTSIYGGRGNIVGTTLGLLLIHETRSVRQSLLGL